MRRPTPRRLTPFRLLIVANLLLFAFLFAFVQWRFSGAESRALRLRAALLDTTESDLHAKASQLELMARHSLDRDRELRQLAPPVDWEAIAAEGADKLSAAWLATSDKLWFKQPGYMPAYPEADPPYPFQRVTLVDGRDTGIVLVVAPFYDTNYYRAEAARALFWRLKAKGHILVGMTSYQEFPGRILNPHDDRHVTTQDEVIIGSVDAWLHCFRDPTANIPAGVPRLLLSESDFHDPDRNDGGGVLIPSDKIKKKYDLVYSNQGGDWNDYARNWTLAKAAIKRLVNQLDLKVLILGRELRASADADLKPYVDSGNIVAEPPGKLWRDFLLALQTARSLFVPNVHDASPRVVVEALCLDIPVVVNKHILGGWKYVNQYTGEFFSSEADVVEAYQTLRSPDRAAELFPREWYKGTWGKTTSSYKLQAFMEAAVGADRIQAIQRNLETFHAAKGAA